MEHAREQYEVSERRACRVVRQWRGTQRYRPLRRADEDELTQAILALGMKYGRYGYRRITVLLRNAGWPVGKDRVQRIWRREGLKVPQKQRPRGRLWLHDGSCIRLRSERANHVWSYDFVKAMTHDGRALRILVLIDEYTRECLGLRVARRLGSMQVIEALADVGWNTTRSAPIRRWVTGPRRRKPSCRSQRGMEIWKTLRVSHIPTPPAATTD